MQNLVQRCFLPIRRLTVRTLACAGFTASALTSSAAQMLVGDGTVSCGTVYVVESGDTLSRVSARAYGDPQLYGFIADANWEALGGNPESIAVGMFLKIPCVDVTGQFVTPEQAAEVTASMDAAVAAEGILSPDELDTLFGPVALFPDQVLTPVLVAVTFPLDVVKAGRFVEETVDLSNEERADQAAKQMWDDSVRELAAGFPDLLTRMSDHIEWTEQAGEAVVAQTDDVLASIQRLRTKAQENGYLVDNKAQTVEEKGDTIVISSASPGVVYVPNYDPQVVYTTPVVGTPVYHYGYDYDDNWGGWDDALVAGGIILGSAIILDEIFDDDDWGGWDVNDDIDWDRGDITIDRGDVNIDRGDRGDINLDRGDRPRLGDGDRAQIGGGGRISIGESDRPQIDRGDLSNRRGNAIRHRPQAGTLPANRTPISNAASRDIARQKIEARRSAGARPANLPSRPQGVRSGSGTRVSGVPSSRQAATRPAARPNAVRQNRPASRTGHISRPAAHRAPAVRAPGRSNAFQRPSGGHRAVSAASRGGRSMSGGGRRGGGGGRRGR